MTVFVEMEDHVCGVCGMAFAAPKVFMDECRKVGAGKSFYCPSGHPRVFRESEVEKIRRECDRLKQEQARLEDEVRAANARTVKEAKAHKRLQKRTSAGTCPCCQRTFANMAEHMKHQHPQFLADGGTTVIPIKRTAKA